MAARSATPGAARSPRGNRRREPRPISQLHDVEIRGGEFGNFRTLAANWVPCGGGGSNARPARRSPFGMGGGWVPRRAWGETVPSRFGKRLSWSSPVGTIYLRYFGITYNYLISCSVN